MFEKETLQDFRLNHSSVIPLLQISSLYRICPHFSSKPRPRYHTVNEGNEGEGLSNLVSKPQDNLRSTNYSINGAKLLQSLSQWKVMVSRPESYLLENFYSREHQRVHITKQRAPKLSTITWGHCLEILIPEPHPPLPSPTDPDSLVWAWKLEFLISSPGGC